MKTIENSVSIPSPAPFNPNVSNYPLNDEIETVVIPELLELTEQTGYLPIMDY
jgi:hypothetical protein